MEAVDIWGVVQGDPTEIRLGMVSLSGGGGEVAEACRRETIVVAAAGGQPIEVTTSHLSLDELPEESVEGDAKNLLALPAFRAFAEELRLEGRRGIVRLRLKCVRAGDEVHVSGRALSGPSADLPASHRDATRPLPDRIDAKRIEVRLRTEGAPRPGHGVGLVQALLASPWGVSAGALAKGWVPLFLLLIFAGTGAFVSGRGLLSPHTFAWLCGAIVAGIAGCRALARAGALPPDPWADEDRPSRMPGPARLLPHVHGLERPLRRGGDYGLTLVSVGLLIIPFVLLWELINPTFGEAARPKLGALVLLFNSALLLISALGYYLADRPVRSILRGLSRALEAPRVDEGGAVAVTGTLAGTAVPLKSQLKPDREVPKTSATIEPDLPGDPTSIRFDGWCSVRHPGNTPVDTWGAAFRDDPGRLGWTASWEPVYFALEGDRVAATGRLQNDAGGTRLVRAEGPIVLFCAGGQEPGLVLRALLLRHDFDIAYCVVGGGLSLAAGLASAALAWSWS